MAPVLILLLFFSSVCWCLTCPASVSAGCTKGWCLLEGVLQGFGECWGGL